MVWLHGGAFIAGSADSYWADGTALAREEGVVVVTVNHRLGVFGYLHLDQLVRDGDFPAAANVGMLDIIAALAWVRENIAAFGGDPENVTLFGESGGGAKICVLMAMPAAAGLFHKAIIQSGPAVEVASRVDAERTASQFLSVLDLSPDRVSDLRHAPPERLLAAQNRVLEQISLDSFADRRRLGFNPVVDGVSLPGGPFEPTAPAISAHIPLMIGTTADEMTLFLGMAPELDSMTESDLLERLQRWVGHRASELVARYRRARPVASRRDLLIAIAGDHGMRMPSLMIAERKLAQRAASVFVYLFAWRTPVLGSRLGSPHTIDIPFVFGTTAEAALVGDGAGRDLLSRQIRRCWATFAHGGDPSHGEIPTWPAYDSEKRPTMIFDLPCRVEADPRAVAI
jgi:para-nitrobenzyl esterase